MKKCISFFLIFVFAFSLTSCNDNDNSTIIVSNKDYRIEKNDDGYYLVFTNNLIKFNIFLDDLRYLNYNIVHPKLSFDSAEQMRTAFLSNTFSEEEKYILADYQKNKDGNIPLFNLDLLYQPKVPEDGKTRIKLYYGDRYSAEISLKKCEDCTFNYFTKEEFDSIYQKRYIDRLAEIKTSAFNVITDEEQNITTCYTKGENGEEYTTVFRTIKTENSMLRIMAGYPGIATPDTLPTSLAIYGVSNDSYFIYRMGFFVEHPDVEWLSQFGVEPVEFD